MSTTIAPPTGAPPASPADGDALYEVVDGQTVELPPMGAYPTWIASLLFLPLGTFAKTQGLGRAVVAMLFRIDPAAYLQRRPDVAFVSYERWPRGRRVPEDAAWDVVPELAIEVVSPTNLAEDLLAKVHEYFHGGVRQVWVVYPAAAQVQAHESPTRIRVLGRGDEIDGGPLLPGLRLPLAELLEDGAESA